MRREDLAVELKARRLRAGLSQASLAKRMGTSQALVARVEGGRVMPGWDFIDRWARVTGIPLQLTFGGGAPAPLPVAAREARIRQAFGEGAFDPWERDPSPVEERTLRRLGIAPTGGQ